MKSVYTILALAATGSLLAACSSTTTYPTTVKAAQTYTQIELLSRPAVKELFEKFVDHQTTNAAEPYNDPTLQGEIQTFTDALRPPNASLGSDYGKALQSVLYPNEMIADVSQTGKAAYLGNETKGATGGGSTFGGRDLADNVIDISLGAVFGNTLGALGLQPEDNEENNCLTSQHLSQNPSQANTGTFPYLSPPH
ncbi:MAG: DUF4331 family protein [Candidatus Eremiobacteraeota bacterium]|nr:DUF4331 family protein [Candidatus Eremiobacteraeota bacterium]